MTKKKIIIKTHNRLLQSQENWRLLIKYEGQKKEIGSFAWRGVADQYTKSTGVAMVWVSWSWVVGLGVARLGFG